MSLKITVNANQPGVLMLELEGQIDREGKTALTKTLDELAEENCRAIVLNMAQVDFITSEGIGVIFQAQKDLRERGAELAMVNLPPQIHRVFETIKLLSFNTVFNTTEELDKFLLAMQQEIIAEEKEKDN